MSSLTVRSYAKINLGLLITGKRPDGYHTLETLFAPIAWHDSITFEPADSITMSCLNADLPVDDSNLCIRAARLLAERFGSQRGVSMQLDKQVPFGAGLGGGSSDAATVLRVLNDFWQIGASLEALHPLAVELGADVPYFLEMPGLAYARGIGDELFDLDLTLPFHILTVFPEQPVSTLWAYKNFYRRFERQVPDLQALVARLCRDGQYSVLAAFENDFEPAVFDHYPAVAGVKQGLLAAGALFASLSGSGSAVYGFFASQQQAEAAAASVAGTHRWNLTPPGFSLRA